MEPTTALGLASIGSTIIGGAVGAGASHNEAVANQQASEYQAAVARNNQVIAETQAQQQDAAAAAARDAGANEGQIRQQQTSQQIGKVRANYAAAGVAVDEGSPLDTVEDTARSGAMDALIIRDNANRRAFGFEQQAYSDRVRGQGYGEQATLDTFSGQAARSAGDIRATSSILGAASSVGDKFLTFKRYGVNLNPFGDANAGITGGSAAP